jgi:PTS system nitrogen regulatory IIA component
MVRQELSGSNLSSLKKPQGGRFFETQSHQERGDGEGMKLLSFLKEEWVIPELSGRDKVSVLEELCDVLVKPSGAASSEELLEILLERERQMSTGIGEGVAIPHGRFEKLKHFLISFGRSTRGVDFHSIDEKPCQIFFMVMAPKNSGVENVNLLGRIARLMKAPSIKKKLMGAKTQKEIFDIIAEEDERY